ncbi:MAG TPA: hypothetical protein VMH02_00940 [Verrucomicrobiae bacterium]|nr:hypothetical protein [Verrucomicrobiae bacterium]
MRKDGLPYPDDETEDVAPDVAGERERPLSPADAVHREQEKYGDTTADENRDDQWDAHHGTPDDIV